MSSNDQKFPSVLAARRKKEDKKANDIVGYLKSGEGKQGEAERKKHNDLAKEEKIEEISKQLVTKYAKKASSQSATASASEYRHDLRMQGYGGGYDSQKNIADVLDRGVRRDKGLALASKRIGAAKTTDLAATKTTERIKKIDKKFSEEEKIEEEQPVQATKEPEKKSPPKQKAGEGESSKGDSLLGNEPVKLGGVTPVIINPKTVDANSNTNPTSSTTSKPAQGKAGVTEGYWKDWGKKLLEYSRTERSARKDDTKVQKKVKHKDLHGKDGKLMGEHIVKSGSGFELKSHKGKNLGKYSSKAGAEKREREVEYFKHHDK
jgi:hypothetical protein